MKTELGMTIESRPPKATPAQVDRLIAELRKAGRSMLAAELALKIFGKATETAKRRIRVIAKVARPRVVSFPGSEGYDLFARCKPEELWRAVDERQAAIRALTEDVSIYLRAIHGKYRGEPGDDGQRDFLQEQVAS